MRYNLFSFERVDNLRIAVDAMGGDNAPLEIVLGAVMAAQKLDVNILLVGDKNTIDKILYDKDYAKEKIEVVHASEVITNEEKPTAAVRSKKDSSLVKSLILLQEGSADAVVSAGNTGALLTSAVKYAKRLNGVLRPALGAVLPSQQGGVLIMDSGANANCKSAYLKQFAIMGSLYAEQVMKKTSPRVGLLNIGAEEGKGNDLVKETYELLKETDINFIGNVEARDVLAGHADVVVCDGFSGNILIKATEGTGAVLLNEMKKIFMSNIISKLCAALLRPGLRNFKHKYDYQENGGAPLLGVNGCIIKAHGSSKAKSIFHTIRIANEFAQTPVVQKIAELIR